MLRLAADDPLALALFSPDQLRGVKKRSVIKRGRRAGKPTEEQKLDDQLEAAGFTGWVREYVIVAPGMYTETGRHRTFRLDFAWPELRFYIEVEGGIWRGGGGAHSHPTNILRDIDKHNALTLLDWNGLRVTTDHVRKKQVIDLLRVHFFTRGWKEPCPTDQALSIPARRPASAVSSNSTPDL